MTDFPDALRPLLDDILATARTAATEEARADALWALSEDCRRWGLVEEAEAARLEARSRRVAALMAHGESAALRARFVDPDNSLLG